MTEFIDEIKSDLQTHHVDAAVLKIDALHKGSHTEIKDDQRRWAVFHKTELAQLNEKLEKENLIPTFSVPGAKGDSQDKADQLRVMGTYKTDKDSYVVLADSHAGPDNKKAHFAFLLAADGKTMIQAQKQIDTNGHQTFKTIGQSFAASYKQPDHDSLNNASDPKSDPGTDASPAAPATKTPGTDASPAAAPATKAPGTDASPAAAPAAKAPGTDASPAAAPATKAPGTDASPAAAPATKAPGTDASPAAPATKAPGTDASPAAAPATKAPGTDASPAAPATKAPGTDASPAAPATKAPGTDASPAAPATKAPGTDASPAAPATKAPDTGSSWLSKFWNSPTGTKSPGTDASPAAPATTAPGADASSAAPANQQDLDKVVNQISDNNSTTGDSNDTAKQQEAAKQSADNTQKAKERHEHQPNPDKSIVTTDGLNRPVALKCTNNYTLGFDYKDFGTVPSTIHVSSIGKFDSVSGDPQKYNLNGDTSAQYTVTINADDGITWTTVQADSSAKAPQSTIKSDGTLVKNQ